MNIHNLEDDRELQQVLWACYHYWDDPALPPDERLFCHRWIVGPYVDRFGAPFAPDRLACLVDLNLLHRAGTSRRGDRRYYYLADPDRVRAWLEVWGLHEIPTTARPYGSIPDAGRSII